MKRKNTLIQYSAAPPVEEEEPESEAVVVTLAANISEQQGKIMSSLETLKGDYVPKAELEKSQTEYAALLARVDKLETNPPGTIEVIDRGPYNHNFGAFLGDVRAAGSPGKSTPERLINYVAGHANEGDDSQGGFLVPAEFIPDLFSKEYIEQSILARTRSLPVKGNTVSIPAVAETSRATGSRWGGVTGAWICEMEEKQPTKPHFELITLTLHEFALFGYATNQLLEDSFITFEALLQQAFASEAQWMAEDSILFGTGAGMPLGIMIAPALVTQARHASQAPARTTVITENIVAMYSRMWGPSWPNAIWLVEQSVIPQLLTMVLAVGAGGGPTYMPPGGLSASPYGSLLGRPVIPCEHCNALGVVGDIILADFSQYAVISKGAQFDTSVHLRFNYDETAFRLTIRMDGQPLWRAPMTPASGGVTLSPFVTLGI